jgi:predicted TPR repeat methyltransferase
MHSSGDLLADRRYAYAEASLKDGDLDAAIDLARQTIEIAPRYAPAWFLIGEARTAQYRGAGSIDEGVAALAEAREAFEMALLRDPEDGQGARLRLAALGIGDPIDAMSPDYVRRLFDDYAIRFDRHLTASLKYRAPALLREAVRRSVGLRRGGAHFARALDLGCGTGLAGEAFRDLCGHLAGVDLAPAMVEKARRKKVYDELADGEIVECLAVREAGSADLVLAADVFVYLADLGPVFAEVARVLAADGLFAFTVQAHEGRGVVLGEDLRYAHADEHLRALAAEAGLRVALSEEASTREDRGVPVPGRLMVLGR